MSKEDPTKKSEVSPDQRNALFEDINRYFEVAKKKAATGSGSCRHIINNLFSDGIEIIHENPELMNATFYRRATESIGYLKRYMALLDEFDDFRKAEEGPGLGFYPEMMRQQLGARDLVDAYERALRGR